MKNELTCSVIMLPVGREVRAPEVPHYVYHLSLYTSKSEAIGKIISYERYMDGMIVPNPKHLYLVSEQEIKEGDWYIEDGQLKQWK